jgi:DNA-binding response OmpR family regulator
LRVILIVEDDTDTNVVIQEVLAEEGYSCIAAFDGTEGFRLLVEHEPDLVLLDVQLPDIGGVEFLELKAQVSGIADIPVIVMTGLMSVPRIDHVLGMLKKPFALETLLDLVRRIAPTELAAPPTKQTKT